ncbi:hypothetical protein [Larkinella soli]|uniref:hypothetical protein n=1 Tax=Larkinella soli TaxID=1770527 RepID=UPI000FFB320C|nr:hypothetical protein [Larkinella soli]
MESASVTEFFQILANVPFWVKALPIAFLGALFTRVVSASDEAEVRHRRDVAYNVVTVLASTALAILLAGWAHEERRLGVYPAGILAMATGVGGVWILMGFRRLAQGFERNPNSTLKGFLKRWLLGKDEEKP